MPPDEQTAIGQIGNALDPTQGDGFVERYGPLILLLVYVGVYIALFMDVVPKPDIAWGLLGLLGPVVGAILMRVGRR